MNNRAEIRRNQLIGGIAGTLMGAMVAATWPAVLELLGWGGALMWGAVIGIALGSLSQFEKLGLLITRSQNRLFNFVVGLCVPLFLVGVLLALVRLGRG